MLNHRKPARAKAKAAAAQRKSRDSVRALWGLHRRVDYLYVALAFAVLVAATTVTFRPATDPEIDADENEIADFQVYAEQPFEVQDLEKTRQARDAAASLVADVYVVDTELIADALAMHEQRMAALRAQRDAVEESLRTVLLESDPANQDTEGLIRDAVARVAAELVGQPPFTGVEDPDVLVPWLWPARSAVPERVLATGEGEDGAPRVESLSEPEVDPLEFAYLDQLDTVVRGALTQTLARGVLQPDERVAALADHPAGAIEVRRSEPIAGLEAVEFLPVEELPVASTARSYLAGLIAESIQSWAGENRTGPVNRESIQRAALAVASLGLQQTLDYNPEATLAAEARAREAVAPVMREYMPDTLIVDRGEKLTEQKRLALDAYYDAVVERETVHPVTTLLGHGLLVLLMLICVVRAAPILTPRGSNPDPARNLSLLLLCGMAVLGRVASHFDPTGYVVPVAAAAILLAILTNVRVALLLGLLCSVVLSMQFQYSWRLFIVATAMSFGGVFAIYQVRRRSDMSRAAFVATAVGLVASIAIIMAVESVLSAATLQRLGLILINGAGILILVPGLLPPLERLFNITTDILLLEYSDLNNEVLSQMAIEVPATYSHSLMLGQLAEAAADAIGANGLLARVCAYYHDIGKMRRPEYFSENQTGTNVHDELAPRLSARAIASHVTVGVEMAREYHLPKPIIDGIREHHGTNLISFFYQEALAQQKHGDVREADFRYPGPRPRSRETAILMICDGVESAVRSIKNPNEERVREMVDKIIQARANDRQFDECDLTLRDLDTIANVLTRRLLTSLHSRVEYPEPHKEKREEVNIIPLSGGGEP